MDQGGDRPDGAGPHPGMGDVRLPEDAGPGAPVPEPVTPIKAAASQTIVEILAFAMSMETNRIVHLMANGVESLNVAEFETLLLMSLASQMAINQWRGHPPELMVANSIRAREAAHAAVEAHVDRPGGGITVAARSMLDGIRMEMEQGTGSLLPLPELVCQPWLGFTGK